MKKPSLLSCFLFFVLSCELQKVAHSPEIAETGKVIEEPSPKPETPVPTWTPGPVPTTTPIPEVHGTPQPRPTPLPTPEPPNPSRPANLAEGLIAHYAFEGNTFSFDGQYNNYFEDENQTNFDKDYYEDYYYQKYIFRYADGITGQGGVFTTTLSGDTYIHIKREEKIGSHFEKGLTFSTWVQIEPGYDIKEVAWPLVQGDSVDHFQFAFYWTPGGGDLILNKGTKEEFWPKRLFSPRSEVQNHDWQHWVVTYDYKKVKIYFNGQLDFQADYEQALPELDKTNLSVGGTSTQLISNEENDELPYMDRMRGMMDEVRIYDRALAPEEVAQLYQYK